MNRCILIALGLLLVGGTSRGQDWAKARLEQSPRKLLWVNVHHDTRLVRCFVALPEAKEKATAVVVIHEIFGLTDWVRSVADQLAEAGFIAIAPDLLSGMAPGGGGTGDFEAGAVRQAIMTLPPDQVTADLRAAAEHVGSLPACDGKVAVAGFCWGGSQAFRFAASGAPVQAAFVFYGSGPPEAADYERIEVPVYGFYAENDPRVNASVPESTRLMKEAGKTYEPVTYAGAVHGFMRSGQSPEATAADRRAREEAWQRWLELLRKL